MPFFAFRGSLSLISQLGHSCIDTEPIPDLLKKQVNRRWIEMVLRELLRKNMTNNTVMIHLNEFK